MSEAMKPYLIKCHPTKYDGVLFRSRLEARWAAFFDLAGWTWEYEPFDLEGWTPDFLVSFPCGHSECNDSHSLLVEVKPYLSIKDFADHALMKYAWTWGQNFPADAAAAFGNNPEITWWVMTHGAGGGEYSICQGWVLDPMELWKEAGLRTRYAPHR